MITRRLIQTGALFLFSTVLWAQDAPKAEVSFDYSFARYAPSASYTKGHSLNGGGGAVKFNLTQSIGIVMDLQGYNSNTNKFVIPPNTYFPGGGQGTASGNLFTYLFGPQFKLRENRVQPFVDVLLGAAHSSVYANAFKQICQPTAGACTFNQSPNGDAFAMSAGGGIDFPISRHLDFRIGEFDYLYTRFTNKFTNAGQNNFRYKAGVNWNIGLPSGSPSRAACDVSPAEVLASAGPVRATAQAIAFNPKHRLVYNWDSNAGRADAGGESATLDTTSLAPGTYTVRASVVDPQAKGVNTATCTASFTVVAPQPTSAAVNGSMR